MDRRKVYVFSFPAAKCPTGLALNCHMYNGYIRFHDTIRGHQIEGKLIHDEEGEYFLFESFGYKKGLWFFKMLTIDDFRKETYQIVEGSGDLLNEIQTTDQLHEWYCKNFGEEAGIYDLED